MSAPFHTRRFAPDAPLRYHASPPLPHRRAFRACTAAKRLPCNHLNPCFIFLQPPVLLNAPKITSPRIQKPANALPPASTSRTRALRCNISRTSDGFPSQLHNQPALKTTPVGILISQFAKQSGHLIPRSYFRSAGQPCHLIRPRPLGFITWRGLNPKGN